MSLSHNHTNRDETTLSFSMKPVPVEPEDGAASQLPPASKAENKADTPPHQADVEPTAAHPASDEAPAGNEQSSQPNQPSEPVETPTEKVQKPSKHGGAWGVLLDTFLVLMVGGVVGGGGFYLHKEWKKYRVPTIMELTQKQCLDLCAQREALQDAANRADEQLRMRRMVSHLENRLHDFSAKNDRLRASIDEQRNRVLALQHEIRQADKESRSVARGLLPGLAIGKVTTKRGRIYDNATIVRLQGKRISLRTPDGAATLPLSELTKENLPDLMLYALGEIDLVDTSDFTSDGTAPAAAKANAKLRDVSSASRKKPARPADYEEPGNGPVVDTDANKTSTSGSGGDDLPSTRQGSGDVWQPPTGELPL